MKYLASYEEKKRGQISFPFEYHYIDTNHPRYQMPFHWHDEYELLHVKSGTFTLTIQNESFTLYGGDFAFITSNAIHGGTAKDCVYECIVFDYIQICTQNYMAFFSELEHIEQYETSSFFINNKELLPPLEALFALFSLEKMDNGIKLQIFGNLFLLMGLLSKTPLPPSTHPVKMDKNIKRIKKVLNHIKQQYSQTITLENLANIADLNPKYLCSLFQNMTGKTPIDYLVYYRIECAGEMLLFSKKNITDIAISCGFNDMSYFSKKFKQLKGVTPMLYRKMMR